MTVEILNKEQFLEAVKRNPKLLLYPQKQCHCNNHGEDIYFFDYSKESFTFQELEELRKKHFNANGNPSCKMSYASHPDIVPRKTGVPRETFLKLIKERYNKPSDMEFLKTLGLTQEEIDTIIIRHEETVRY